jgi:hypothetical protein
MDVHDPVRVARDEPWGEEAHVAGEADQVAPAGVQQLGQLAVVLLPRAAPAVIDDGGLDPERSGPSETGRGRLVREDERDRRRDPARARQGLMLLPRR